MDKKLRIGFMGSPDFVVPTLEALITHPDIEVVCVYTQPPRPKGRGSAVQKTPVHDAALTQNLEVRTPVNFKDPEDVKAFAALNLDTAIVAAYGLMLPDEILNAPKHGCINIHPSLLPRWRGVSPIQFALWKGDEKTGVSIMGLVKEMDAGPVYVQDQIDITPQSTAQDLSDRLWPMGTKLLLEVLESLIKTGTLNSKEQDHEAATFCHKLTKEHGRIDWSLNASEIDRQIRALNPWPGTWSVLPDGKRLKILSAAPGNADTQGKAGMVLDSSGHISCGDGQSLTLQTLQPEGKKPMDFAAALNGGYIKPGDLLI